MKLVRFNFKGLLTLPLGVFLAFALSVHAESAFSIPNKTEAVSTEKCPADLEGIFDSRPYSTDGVFRPAPERQTEVRRIFRSWVKESKSQAHGPSKLWRAVEEKDLVVNFNKLTPEEERDLISKGASEISKLAIVTSGAGLWSRGGGQVKALVPFNLKSLLTFDEAARLVKLGDIVKADTPEKVLNLGEPKRHGESDKDAVARIRREAEAEIEALLSRTRYARESLNALDVKLVNAALLTMLSGHYVTLDIWTSQQTHKPIAQYLSYFRHHFATKIFSSDPNVDSTIKRALLKYTKMSDRLGETHLFGYQEGIQGLKAPTDPLHPLDDPQAGETAEGTEYIGEGAGMLKSYLDKSGRTERLQKLGKTQLLFENIEVQNNWALINGAHIAGKHEVSVILVPQYKGESGGNGFMVKEADGTEHMELHETAVMSDQAKQGHSFFNSNTIVSSLNLAAPATIDFEKKDGGLIYRAKINAGDITKSVPAVAIGGRRPQEYVNQKSYKEFIDFGNEVIQSSQTNWNILSSMALEAHARRQKGN